MSTFLTTVCCSGVRKERSVDWPRRTRSRSRSVAWATSSGSYGTSSFRPTPSARCEALPITTATVRFRAASYDHGVVREGRRARGRRLFCPAGAVPLPGIGKRLHAVVATYENDSLPCRVAHHRMISAGRWARGRGQPMPAGAVPLPGVVQCCHVPGETAKEQDALPDRIVRHGVGTARGGARGRGPEPPDPSIPDPGIAEIVAPVVGHVAPEQHDLAPRRVVRHGVENPVPRVVGRQQAPVHLGRAGKAGECQQEAEHREQCALERHGHEQHLEGDRGSRRRIVRSRLQRPASRVD